MVATSNRMSARGCRVGPKLEREEERGAWRLQAAVQGTRVYDTTNALAAGLVREPERGTRGLLRLLMAVEQFSQCYWHSTIQLLTTTIASQVLSKLMDDETVDS